MIDPLNFYGLLMFNIVKSFLVVFFVLSLLVGVAYLGKYTKPKTITQCINLCGNNICEQIVCLGEQCPCMESLFSCPSDCDTSRY